jgi:glycosyltransferase involved in cell wall biosynthesis
MEAWLQGHPVVVHSECLATRIPVEATGGGWAPATEAQWADVFARIELATAAELGSIGERGRAYAREHADWTKAIDRYEEALELRPAPRRSSRPPRRRRRAIHQLLPNLAYGDAISNQATFMREVLNDLGYESEIFVQYVDNPMRYLARPFEPGAIRPRDGLLYHHSIGTELTAFAVRHKGPKALIYHNVTPASFFEPWDPPHARLVAAGRKGLSELAPAFPISAGVSQYNASELRAAGFRDPRVLPIFVEPLRWDQAADPEWMKALQDGRTNLLFVGRVAPNKCQHDLVEAFAQFLSYDAHARLLLIGAWLDGDRYATYVRQRAQQLGIASQVVSTRCTDAQLLACYRTADLFWSMSEHEGFCVPLVEAMWFDIPVLGFRSSAIPETLGQAGLMFAEKRPAEVAALAHLLIEEGPLRRTIVEAQRRRRRDFLPDATLSSLLELLRALGADDVAETRVVS